MDTQHLTIADVARFLGDTSEPHAEIAAHLATCSRCRSEMDFQLAIAGAVRAESHVEPPFDFTNRVMAEIVPSPRRSRIPAFFRNAPAMLMAAGVAAVMIIVGVQGPSLRTAERTGPAASHALVQAGQQASQSITDIVVATSQSAISAAFGRYGMMIVLVGISLSILLGIDRALSHRTQSAK